MRDHGAASRWAQHGGWRRSGHGSGWSRGLVVVVWRWDMDGAWLIYTGLMVVCFCLGFIGGQQR